MKKITMLLATTALLLMFMVNSAMATTYRNPAYSVGAGKMGGALLLSDPKLALMLDYGLSNEGTISGVFENMDIGFGEAGTGFGVNYGHIFSKTTISGKPSIIAGLGRYTMGSVGGGDYTQMDVGGGLSMALSKQANVYGLAAYRRFTWEYTFTFFGVSQTVSVSEAEIGVALGGDYAVNNQFTVGGELHVGFSNTTSDGDTFGLWGAYKF